MELAGDIQRAVLWRVTVGEFRLEKVWESKIRVLTSSPRSEIRQAQGPGSLRFLVPLLEAPWAHWEMSLTFRVESTDKE